MVSGHMRALIAADDIKSDLAIARAMLRASSRQPRQFALEVLLRRLLVLQIRLQITKSPIATNGMILCDFGCQAHAKVR
ncbi:hypothetical protein EOD23_14935 [Mesorhizobium sp. USDA-HM6]|nr:hypothetical protein EOD23_14935 [Mesorhizobium sp. USDA-HM6]